MLLRLSNQTFKRQFGPFTYFFHRLNASDRVFRDAEVFCEKLTRVPTEKSEMVNYILSIYTDGDKEEICRDFDEFVTMLVQEGYLLAGDTPEALDAQEQRFTYNVEKPKTIAQYERRQTADGGFSKISQDVLGEYFREHPTLFSLHMDITQNCTERCRHCYIPAYNPLYLSYEKICSVLDEFRAMGGLSISLSGGECMMHKDFTRIVQAIRERDCTVGVLSNLTVCTDEKIRVLREADATVQVSLYSMVPEIHDAVTCLKGSWKRTVDAIIRLRAADVPVRISCPCLQINYQGYPDVIKFAESLKMSAQTDFIIMAKYDGDCSNLCNRLTIPQTREILEDVILRAVPTESEYFAVGKKAEMPSPEAWMAQKACGAGVDSLCLAANGDFYPCPAFGDYVIGNVHQQSLREVWLNSEKLNLVRHATKAKFPKCAVCKDRDYCSICLCRNYNETGDMFTPAEHFCKVAEQNHIVVDMKHEQMKKLRP